jgi:hypothetical protein
MTCVYYAMTLDERSIVERQWIQSIRSLRRYSRDVRVLLVVYGEPQPATMEEAAASGVEVVRLGAYDRAFRDLPPHWTRTLSRCAAVPKYLALRHGVAGEPGPVLYVDCDTFFFEAPERLMAAYSDVDFCAREEPGSRRSHYNYDPSHLDEDLLRHIARDDGVIPIEPYNTGVMVMNGGLASTLAWLVDDFLWYCWRFLVGAALWRPESMLDGAQLAYVRADASPSDELTALPFPCEDAWVVDQVAWWLTLGRVPGLRHRPLSREDVAQNGEFVDGHGGRMLVHYYSSGEAAFFSRVGTLGPLELAAR